jgi:transcriptional regulator with GAF, ATPase, and Fis domain
MDEFLKTSSSEIKNYVVARKIEFAQWLQAIEREVIREVLRENAHLRYPVAASARALGYNRTTMHMKLVELGLRKKSSRRLGVFKNVHA